MTSLDTSAAPASTASVVTRHAVALFASTLFVSALLLFAVQPMFTKLVLPKLGGSPSVWSTAMVAFQTFLFAGYLYAHVLARTLSPARGAMAHLLLLAIVAMMLPLGIAPGFDMPPAEGVTLWLAALFAMSIGLPFAALSASAPLLQNWFVATGHPQAKNPYVLYAASNLGSFAALLAYPFLIEPFLTLRTQLAVWTFGFGVLAAGICVVGFAVAASRGPALAAGSGERTTWAMRLSWTALTAIPAGLCIAVTAYITTDLAAAPFLWIVPLALYLLTFVGVFRERPWLPHASVLRYLPYAIAPVAISMLGGDKVHWLAVMLLHLTAFVLIAFACHGEAYRLRPAPGRLTEFYLWTSFGGVVGGVFAGLVAPNIFNNTWEYPILIAASVLALPGVLAGGWRGAIRGASIPLAIAAGIIALRATGKVHWLAGWDTAIQIGLILLVAAMLLSAANRARFFGLIVLAFAITAGSQTGLAGGESVRSFFGVHQLVESPGRSHRLLFHGTTIHGAERVRGEAGQPVTGRPEPLTYYYFGGPISDTVKAVRTARGALQRVAAVGLGTGSMACHKQAGESWTFYEIDPEVVRIAKDPAKFRFLSACAPQDRIVVGDARLTLAASAEIYDLIVIDAFSSDAIPVHLLTREAMAGYLTRLAPGGVIVMHISNRHMELASVVAAVAAAEGLTTFFKQDRQANNFQVDYRANAQVVALAKSEADVGDLPQRSGWSRLEPRAGVTAWTDDYSDVLRAILRKKF